MLFCTLHHILQQTCCLQTLDWGSADNQGEHVSVAPNESKINALSYCNTRCHKTWYPSALCLLSCIPERGRTSDSNLRYYQSVITVIVAVLLIHISGRKSKSHPGVQHDVSHLCVYTQTDVGQGWQIMSLPHTSERSDNISFIMGLPAMTSLSGSDSTLLFTVSVNTLVCIHLPTTSSSAAQ